MWFNMAPELGQSFFASNCSGICTVYSVLSNSRKIGAGRLEKFNLKKFNSADISLQLMRYSERKVCVTG